MKIPSLLVGLLVLFSDMTLTLGKTHAGTFSIK